MQTLISDDGPRRLDLKLQPHQRIVVALDVATEREALHLVAALRDAVGFFKVGLELFTSEGPDIVRRIVAEGGRIFLDCKFMDIPATVAGASRSAARLGVSMFDIHCLGGRAMMRSAVEAAHTAASAEGVSVPWILGVTILTSIDQGSLESDLNITAHVRDQVVHLGRLAVECGLDGLVASANEVAALRETVPASMVLVTPGVRPSWAARDDQKRIATPRDAITAGADLIVVGRPITRPPREVASPLQAARLIAEELATGGRL